MIQHGLGIRKMQSEEHKDLLAGEIQLVDVAQNLAVHPDSAALVSPLIQPAYENIKDSQRKLEQQRQGGLGMQMPLGLPGAGGG
jgi:hypothetical protein